MHRWLLWMHWSQVLTYAQKSWGLLLNISRVSNLQHPVSSLPSVHCRVPSQRLVDGMHWRLLHWNAPDLQDTVWTEFNGSNQDNRNGEFNCHLHWWVSDFRLVQLTAVHLIASISTWPEPITLWRGGDTMSTGGTLKLAGRATWVNIIQTKNMTNQEWLKWATGIRRNSWHTATSAWCACCEIWVCLVLAHQNLGWSRGVSLPEIMFWVHSGASISRSISLVVLSK